MRSSSLCIHMVMAGSWAMSRYVSAVTCKMCLQDHCMSVVYASIAGSAVYCHLAATPSSHADGAA